MFGLFTVLIGGPTFAARPITRTFNWFKFEWEFHYGSAINISEDPNNPNFQSQALSALIRLETTPTMQGAITSLEASGNQLNIIPYVPPAGWGPFNAYCSPNNGTNAQ